MSVSLAFSTGADEGNAARNVVFQVASYEEHLGVRQTDRERHWHKLIEKRAISQGHRS